MCKFVTRLCFSCCLLSVFVSSASLAVGTPVPGVDQHLEVAAGPKLPLVAPVDPKREASSYLASGRQAMVAAAHPLASEAGYAILKAGGNAVDAAVAASFVISVVRPQSSGIGGGGFLLHYAGSTQQTEAIDFRERAPQAATAGMYQDTKGDLASYHVGGVKVADPSVNGHRSVAVPGLVKGLLQVHAKHGRLPLAQVMQPAIAIAAQGFPVYPGLAEALQERADILRLYPTTVKIFFSRGQPLQTGDVLVQSDLAWTLKMIAAQGEAVFYRGLIAKLISAEMQRGQGLVTAADLAAYRVKVRTPVTGVYRGHKIISFPPPSAGGATIVEILNILAARPEYPQLAAGSAASLHLLAEAMRLAFADRMVIGDPDFVSVPLKGLLSPVYAAHLATSIDPHKATPSSAVKPGQPQQYEHPSTTHLSVVDAAGNAVSTTQTVNYSFGSGVVAAGTGIVLNDEMDDFAKKPGAPNVFGLVGSHANAIAPGKTMVSSMSPTLVFTPNGALRLVLGSPGGPRIINATVQTILHVIDHHMSLGDAVQSARIHQQWMPDLLYVEKDGFAPGVESELVRMGYKIAISDGIGDVQAIGIEAGGILTGASDTRSEGVPLGY